MMRVRAALLRRAALLARPALGPTPAAAGARASSSAAGRRLPTLLHSDGPARGQRTSLHVATAVASSSDGAAGESTAKPQQQKKGGGGGGGGQPKGGKGGKPAAADGAGAGSGSGLEEQRRQRIAKVEALKAAGQEAFAYTWKATHSSAALQALHAGLPPGSDAPGSEGTSVAGRVLARRVFGKLAFLSLRDESGTIQLYVDATRLAADPAAAADASGAADPSAVPPAYERIKSLVDVGDIVGAVGPVRRTEKGELSIAVSSLSMLTKALLPLPDKWHGLTDKETRYRQRYLDLIVNPGVREALRARARAVSTVRRALEARGFLEIETPVLQDGAGGADARPFRTFHNALGQEFVLRIATELHLKRMVVGGFDRVFELGRVFRNEGISTRHNPEFTSVEIYQAYADYTDMMALTEDLVCACVAEVKAAAASAAGAAAAQVAARAAAHGAAAAQAGAGAASQPPLSDADAVMYQGVEISFKRPWRRASMRDLVKDATGVDFYTFPRDAAGLAAARAAGAAALAKAGHKPGLAEAAPSVGHVLNELFEALVESTLMQPTFVTDHPVEISPLAKPHRTVPGATERFELFVYGRELANAFSELTDPIDQRARLEAQVALHAAKQADAAADELYDVLMDEDFVTALEHGLPPTAGLGIGVDRLVMLLTDAASIRDVIAFPLMKRDATPAGGGSAGGGSISAATAALAAVAPAPPKAGPAVPAPAPAAGGTPAGDRGALEAAVAAAAAAVKAQGEAVRALKTGGKGNTDPEVAAAVAELTRRKGVLAVAEGALKAAA